LKQYPSILKAQNQLDLDTNFWLFDKLDGSNLRFEWDRQGGWCRFGTRTQMLKPDHPWLGAAIPLFFEQWASVLEDIARQQKWPNFTAFFEFWGINSFAGFHDPNDIKHLTLIDVHVYKMGLLSPEVFLDLYGHLKIAKFLGTNKLSIDLLEEIRFARLEGISFEGVIGKAGASHQRTMFKAKTQAWIDRIREKFSPEEAIKILSS
jgi:hypothetical protein